MKQELKPIGPYVIGQVVEYVGKPSTTKRRYELSTSRWHVLQVRSQSQLGLEGELIEEGFGAYCPKVKIKRAIKPHVHREFVVPMFRGWLFAAFDTIDNEWARIASLDGVIRVLMVDTRPVPVAPVVMARVRLREAEENDPYRFRLGEGQDPLKIGDIVRLLAGPFFGFMGEVVEIDAARRRLAVELDIFGRKTPAQCEAEQVERI